MAVKQKVFIVADGHIVSSRKHEKDFYAGEEIDLSHLAPEELEALKESGAIVEKHEVK